MSDYIYEARKMDLWFEYADLGGKVDFETFMKRDLHANEYVLKVFRRLGKVAGRVREVQLGLLAGELSSAEIGEPEFNYDDPADAYSHPQGGI